MKLPTTIIKMMAKVDDNDSDALLFKYETLRITARCIDYILGDSLKDPYSKTLAIGLARINSFKIDNIEHSVDVPEILKIKQDASLTGLEFIKTLDETDVSNLRTALGAVQAEAMLTRCSLATLSITTKANPWSNKK